MRYLLLLVLSVSIVAAAGERLKLSFWDASGEKYTTDTFGSALDLRFPGIRPVLMLVAMQRDNSLEFRREKSEVMALGHDIEDLQLLVAIASGDHPNKSGYWLTPHTAATLLGGKQFAVLFLRGDGTLCNKSSVVVSAAVIRKLVRECRQPPPNNSFKPNPLRGSA